MNEVAANHYTNAKSIKMVSSCAFVTVAVAGVLSAASALKVVTPTDDLTVIADR